MYNNRYTLTIFVFLIVNKYSPLLFPPPLSLSSAEPFNLQSRFIRFLCVLTAQYRISHEILLFVTYQPLQSLSAHLSTHFKRSTNLSFLKQTKTSSHQTQSNIDRIQPIISYPLKKKGHKAACFYL